MRVHKAIVETIAEYGQESVPMTPSLCRQFDASHRQMVRLPWALPGLKLYRLRNILSGLS